MDRAMKILSWIGWALFWFLSFLGALLAFRFVPGGYEHGFLPGLEDGFWAALYQGVFVGIRDDFSHIFYHVQDRLTPLLVHILIGVPALTFIPFQLWRGFRNRHRKLHIWMGRIAIVSIIFSAWGAINLALNMDIPAWGQTGFVVGATVWIVSAIVGFQAIRQKNLARHQSAMVVVAAMTFGAVMIRLEFPIWRQMFSFETAYACAAWSSWVLNLAAVGLGRAGRASVRRRRRVAA
jgi:hypothetical protein